MFLNENVQTIDKDPAQPAEQLAFGVPAKCGKIAIRAQHRLLDQIGRADANAQLLVDLRCRQETQIIAVRLEKLSQSIRSTLARRVNQSVC